MSTTPYARLRASINGAGVQTGGITVAASATVAFSFEDTTGWTAYRLEVLGPQGWTPPVGWTTENGVAIYTGVTAPPPQWTLPAIDIFGKWMCRLVVNGGTKNGQANHVDLTDEATALRMASAGGLVGMSARETSQFGGAARAWTTDPENDLRLLGGGTFLRAPVRVATATAIAASTIVGTVRTANANGALGTINGVTMAVGDSVLDKDTTDKNGIWVITSLGSAGTPWVMTRRSDADTAAKFPRGFMVVANEGTANPKAIYEHTTSGTITLGTTALTFEQPPGGTATGLSIASEAQGDFLTRGASAWGRLAVGNAGQVPKSNGAGANAGWTAGFTLNRAQRTSTGSGNNDFTEYTVPASPSGNGRAVLTGILVRVDTALVGSGSTVLSVGASAGGQEYILNFTINSGVAAGTIVGLTLTELGASFTAAKGYSAELAASATVVTRLANSGTISTPPVVTVHALGFNLNDL